MGENQDNSRESTRLKRIFYLFFEVHRNGLFFLLDIVHSKNGRVRKYRV
jgi:hypothetical protein